MTPQEINEKVARKLGNDLRVYNKVDVYKKQPNGNYILTQIPAYCTSISAAWEIVDVLRKQGYRVVVSSVGQNYSECVIFSKLNEKIVESSDIASMAICLAFLKLLEIKSK